ANARIVTLDAQTGDERNTILSGPVAQCQLGMAWSPDGRYLAYGGLGFHQGCIEGVRLGLWSWEASTGMTRQLFDGTSSAPLWMADGTVLAEVAARGGPTGLLPISLASFQPDGSAERVLADTIPNMFPPPSPLFQTAKGRDVLDSAMRWSGRMDCRPRLFAAAKPEQPDHVRLRPPSLTRWSIGCVLGRRIEGRISGACVGRWRLHRNAPHWLFGDSPGRLLT
ncbi:MAG TPA: hypothetical protein VK821_10115, partial [Dehalococcoidia bacterium]|nr:hypothetical protein [Dehalococcoidia bacterium]